MLKDVFCSWVLQILDIFSSIFQQAKNMVIPYMPMLVPPTNWTGYDNLTHFSVVFLTLCLSFLLLINFMIISVQNNMLITSY